MSNLIPLFSMLERTGADELRVAAGEIPYVLTGGQRRDIAAQPIQPRVVLNAAVELLSQEELDGLCPRTARAPFGTNTPAPPT